MRGLLQFKWPSVTKAHVKSDWVARYPGATSPCYQTSLPTAHPQNNFKALCWEKARQKLQHVFTKWGSPFLATSPASQHSPGYCPSWWIEIVCPPLKREEANTVFWREEKCPGNPLQFWLMAKLKISKDQFWNSCGLNYHWHECQICVLQGWVRFLNLLWYFVT